jgi:hypothetical protein
MMIDQREATGPALARARDSVPVTLPPRDVRRKRPPALSFLLKLETLRKVGRVVSLLLLDYVGVVGALVTALLVKLAVRGHPSLAVAWHESRPWIAFAYLVTVLLFARADLYADRPRRPGLRGITSALFQTTVVALIFALANGEHFQSYYIFYGSLFFGTVYITTLRYLHLHVTGRLLEIAGYRRRALLVGSGGHIEAVAHALAGRSRTPVDVVGYMSLRPRPQNGLRSLGRLEELPTVLREEQIQEVIIADPDFPEDRAVELVDLCHNRGVGVHIAPSTMEILIKRAEFVPGESVPLFTLRPPVFEGIDYLVKRSFDLVGAALIFLLLSPLLLDPARDGGPAVQLPEVPHDARGRRGRAGRAGADERGVGGAVQDPRRPAHHLDRAPAAALLARRAAAAAQRPARGDVARRPPAAADARLRAAGGMAQEALPRAAGDDRAVAGLRPRRAELRRPRPARLPVPGALVDLPRPVDPAEDGARGPLAPRRLLSARPLGCRARCRPPIAS